MAKSKKSKAARARHAANKARSDSLRRELLTHVRQQAKGLRKKHSLCILWKNGNAECASTFTRGGCRVRVVAKSRVGKRTTYSYIGSTRTSGGRVRGKHARTLREAFDACAAAAGHKRKRG